MLQILNQTGDVLLLDADKTLVLEQQAGLLENDSLPGGFSYPLDFPLTGCPANERFVRQSHRPAASGKLEVAVQILVDGGLYRAGVLAYRLDNGRGSGTLRLDYSAATDELARKSLVDALSTPVFLGAQNPGELSARMAQIARMTPGSFPCTFFPVRNEAFMDESFTASSLVGAGGAGYARPLYVNAVDGGGKFIVDSSTQLGQPVVPFFYLTWVVEQLVRQLGYRLAGNWTADAAVRRLVVLNMTAIHSAGRTGLAPEPGRADGSGTVSQYWAKPGLHLPDLTVGDFLKAIRERFGLFFRWDSRNRVCYLDRYVDLLTAPAIDLRSAKYRAGSSLTDATREGFRVIEFVDPADELRRNQDGGALELPALVYGDGKNEVKLRVGTCSMIREARPDSRTLVINDGLLDVQGTYWNIPALRLAGNVTDPFFANSERAIGKDGLRKNSLGLLLLSYEGDYRDGRGQLYPYATPYPDGAPAIRLAGKNGGWLQGLRSVFSFRAQAKTLAQTLLLPVAQAASLLPGDRLLLRDSAGSEASGLLDKIQVELPARAGLVTCTLTTQLLPPPGESARPALNPTVYVELKQTPREIPFERLIYPVRRRLAGVDCRLSRTYLTLSVAVYADMSKTRPIALPGGVELMLRIREENYPDAEESQAMTTAGFQFNRLVITQQAAEVIDPAFERRLQINDLTTGATIVNRERWVSLDPGPGYIIL